MSEFRNPFRPGAGHMPPHLAGREGEQSDFQELLNQDAILKNLVLTGLRGVGKTVLLETFKPMAITSGWLWAGTDLSESCSISEEHMATRLVTDLAVVTSSIAVGGEPQVGFTSGQAAMLDFVRLRGIYDTTPGLASDKLKGVLEAIWPHIEAKGVRGIVFAYDEAQNLDDHKAKDQYPLSLLLDTFQSLQRKGMRFLLALTGLPTLFPKLVEARTSAERMFHIVTLGPLDEAKTKESIRVPTEKPDCPVRFGDVATEMIWNVTKGYPYFIQYVCREVYDVWIQNLEKGVQPQGVPVDPIMRKLDIDFFAGRWARATDRQRSLLGVIAALPNCDGEFTVQEIVEGATNKSLSKPFGSSHVSQMLAVLSDSGLIFKNRHGKYSFAVPLLGDFVKRQAEVVEPWA